MKRVTLAVGFFVASFFAPLVSTNAADVEAGRRGLGVALVQQNDYFTTDVTIPVARKKNQIIKRTFTLACYEKTLGHVKETSRGLLFRSLRSMYTKTRKQSRKNLIRRAYKAANKRCRNPQFLSLAEYRGPFGPAEAKLLYERFAFAGSPNEIATAVQLGLRATVEKLTTYVSEGGLDAYEKDLQCDGRLADDEDNETCDPSSPNDLYTPGVRYGVYGKMRYTQNPFFEKMFLFLHDERMAASSEALSSKERHALLTHLGMLRRAASSGDYMQFMREYNSDHLGHLRWLDGADNKGTHPNENYAREFWELGTVGPTARDGSAVYSDLDLSQSALAFSGWTIISEKYTNSEGKDYWVYWPAYSSALHAPGAKRIFQGTRYETVVYNSDDVLRATFAHPRTAEHLAEDLWKEFINPFPTSTQIAQLATVVRKNNFNLTAVMRVIMRSQAVFAERSRKSLIKHPVELLVGFLRITGYPLSYSTMDSYLRELGQRPLLPPTVFGWDETRLAGEPFVLSWRNVVLDLMNRGDSLEDEDDYNLRQVFLTGLPGNSSPARETVERVASWFNIPLNEKQVAALEQYLNYERDECEYWDSKNYGCTRGEYFLKREVFDAALDADSYYRDKLQGLLGILLMLPEYRLK